MGYYVDMTCYDVVIPKENVDKALKAINGMFTPARLMRDARGGHFDGRAYVERWYSWVTNPPAEGFPDLPAALDAWGFGARITEQGDCQVIYSSNEKLGQEDLMLNEIAPYVTPGGSIECRGEDSALWRWLFDGKRCVEQHGIVTYT